MYLFALRLLGFLFLDFAMSKRYREAANERIKIQTNTTGQIGYVSAWLDIGFPSTCRNLPAIFP
jgi:hypothetical protein